MIFIPTPSNTIKSYFQAIDWSRSAVLTKISGYDDFMIDYCPDFNILVFNPLDILPR